MPKVSTSVFTDKNMFAYCDNNPLVRVDDEGEFWHIVAGAVVGAAIGAISEALNGGSVETILVSAVAGGLSGGLACTGLGVGALVAANVAISAGEEFTKQAITFRSIKQIDYSKVVYEGVVGGVTAAVSKGGSGSKHLNNLGKQTVKRTVNTTANKGLKAGVKEATKAFSYYGKNTKSFAKSFSSNTIKDIVNKAIKFVIDKIIGW